MLNEILSDVEVLVTVIVAVTVVEKREVSVLVTAGAVDVVNDVTVVVSVSVISSV